MYSYLEKHNDGSWWYHRRSYETKEEAEESFRKSFWWDIDRKHKIIKHNEQFPDMTLSTFDFHTFKGIGGLPKIEINITIL